MRLRRTITLILALLLFASAASAATSFRFRGITWDTTAEQMLEAEGLTQEDYNTYSADAYTYYYLLKANVYYVFRGAQLVQAYTVLAANSYAAKLESLTSLYGDPAAVTADTVASLINTTQSASPVAPEFIANLAAWRLSDGTLAALFAVDGKTFMAYFHEKRIAGGE